MRRRIPNIILKFIATFSVFALFPLFANAQLTDAEKLSMSSIPPSKEELKLRSKRCKLTFQTSQFAGLPEGLHAFQVNISQLLFLPLTSIYSPTTSGGSDTKILAYKPLPNGGIGFRDFCGNFVAIFLAGEEPGSISQVLGLRLPLDLDISKKYPTAWDEIKTRGQLLVASGQYVGIPVRDTAKIGDLYSEVFDLGAVDHSRFLVTFDSLLLIPVLATGY